MFKLEDLRIRPNVCHYQRLVLFLLITNGNTPRKTLYTLAWHKQAVEQKLLNRDPYSIGQISIRAYKISFFINIYGKRKFKNS